jgi:hypothetical protein
MFITFNLFKDNVGNIISLVDEPIIIGHDNNALLLRNMNFCHGRFSISFDYVGKRE